MRRMPRWSLLLLVLSVLAFAGTAWALSTLTLTGPGEGAGSVGTEFDFEWSLEPDVDVTSPDLVSYDLYLSKTLSGLDTSPLSSGLTFADYAGKAPSGTLDEDSLYFWKVVAHTPSGDVGATSFFTTGAGTGLLNLVTPSNGQTGVAPQNIEFKWTYGTGIPGPDHPELLGFYFYLSTSLQGLFDPSSRVDDEMLAIYNPETGLVEAGMNLTGELSHGTKYYWLVVAHVSDTEDIVVFPHSFTTMSEASDPNLTGGCSAAPLGGLAAMTLLAGLALVKRRN